MLLNQLCTCSGGDSQPFSNEMEYLDQETKSDDNIEYSLADHSKSHAKETDGSKILQTGNKIKYF